MKDVLYIERKGELSSGFTTYFTDGTFLYSGWQPDGGYSYWKIVCGQFYYKHNIMSNWTHLNTFEGSWEDREINNLILSLEFEKHMLGEDND